MYQLHCVVDGRNLILDVGSIREPTSAAAASGFFKLTFFTDDVLSFSSLGTKDTRSGSKVLDLLNTYLSGPKYIF